MYAIFGCFEDYERNYGFSGMLSFWISRVNKEIRVRYCIFYFYPCCFFGDLFERVISSDRSHSDSRFYE